MFIPSSLNIHLGPVLLAIPAFVMILAVVLILIFRRHCAHHLPRCLRPFRYIKDEIFTTEFALEEIVVDTCTPSEYVVPLQSHYFRSPASTGYPRYAVQSRNVSMSHTFPPFSSSSLSSSSASDGLPSLDNARRGRKRKRISSSDDDSDHWMLEERHYLLPHPPLTEAEVLKRLEKGFTGEIPDGGKPEFFIYNW